MLDSKKYEILWMRWTVVDWVLGLLAAGTAITAATKNAFTTHSQAAAVAAAAANSTRGRNSGMSETISTASAVKSCRLKRSTQHSAQTHAVSNATSTIHTTRRSPIANRASVEENSKLHTPVRCRHEPKSP